MLWELGLLGLGGIMEERAPCAFATEHEIGLAIPRRLIHQDHIPTTVGVAYDDPRCCTVQHLRIEIEEVSERVRPIGGIHVFAPVMMMRRYGGLPTSATVTSETW